MPAASGNARARSRPHPAKRDRPSVGWHSIIRYAATPTGGDSRIDMDVAPSTRQRNELIAMPREARSTAQPPGEAGCADHWWR